MYLNLVNEDGTEQKEGVRMIFEVYRGKVGLMKTESIVCIPDKAELIAMQKSGHTFKIDGKAVSVQKVCEFVAEHKKK